MTRRLIVVWHALTLLIAAVLFFLFTLPRWWEFAGSVSHTTGTVLRIVTGALVASLAAPTYLDLVRVRRPELRTPQLSLTLHWCSIVGSALSGLTIAGIAVAEIPVPLEKAGAWFFAGYAGAAAAALLASLAFYLAFAAETAPKVKPIKPLKAGLTSGSDDSDDAESVDDETERGAGDTAAELVVVEVDEVDVVVVEDADGNQEVVVAEAHEVIVVESQEPTAEEPGEKPEDAPVSSWKPEETEAKADKPAGKTRRLRNRRPQR